MFKRILLLLALFLASYSSFADTTSWKYKWQYGTHDWVTDPSTACAQGNATGTVATAVYDTSYNPPYYCDVYDPRQTNPTHSKVSLISMRYCISGATPDYSQDPSNWCTPPDNPCLNNDVVNPFIEQFQFSSNSGSMPVDDGTCKITNVTLLRCYLNSAGTKYCFFKYYKTKEKKDSSQPPNAPNPVPPTTSNTGPTNKGDTPSTSPQLPPDTKGNCPAGTVQAGYDSSGIPICVGMGTTPNTDTSTPTTTTSPPVTTNNSDGSTTTTQTTTQQNTDGSTTKTTTTTTTAADGTKTVSQSSTTSNAASGDAGKQDSTQKDFCQQNPGLSVCKNSSVSGSCGQITCQGDAIQCATLRASAAMQCQQQSESDAVKNAPSTALGNSILAGTDPMQGSINSALKGDSVDMSSTALDQTAFIGSGSCIADKSFTVAGKSVTMSFSSICSNIQPLRYVVMACAFLVAYLLVSKSVISA